MHFAIENKRTDRTCFLLHSFSTFALHGTIWSAHYLQNILLDATNNRKKNKTISALYKLKMSPERHA